MLTFEDRCFQWASGFYLTEHIPDEWFDEDEYDEDDQNEYLENNLWEPFQFYSADMIAKEIASLAYWIQEGNYPKKEDN
jgi:hypothetical protein